MSVEDVLVHVLDAWNGICVCGVVCVLYKLPGLTTSRFTTMTLINEAWDVGKYEISCLSYEVALYIVEQVNGFCVP